MALKCKDSLIIASDSQGTTDCDCQDEAGNINTDVKKIFSSESGHIVIAGAGYQDETDDFVRNMDFTKKFSNVKDVKREIFESINRFLEPDEPISEEAPINMSLYSRSLSLILGTVLNNGKYCLYNVSLNKNTGLIINLIDDIFFTLGSGRNFASLLLKQQSRIFDFQNLEQDLAIGILLYVLDEVKHIDSKSGGEIQICVLGEGNANIIDSIRQAKCYEELIEKLAYALCIDLSDSPDIRKVLKRIFPLSQTVYL